MESNKQHFRHILLFYYRKGKNAVQARKKLTDVYGEDVLTVRQCQNWFAKFRSGNFDVEDAPRSGRPVEADKDTIKALVDANRRITTREIGERLNLSNSTVYDHLKGLGLTSKLDIWVPHVLTERNLCRRVDAKSFYSLNGIHCHTHPILQIWRLRIIICSGHCKIFWTVKPLLQMKRSKITWISFLPAKTKNFMSVESCYYQKDGKRCWTRMANI